MIGSRRKAVRPVRALAVAALAIAGFCGTADAQIAEHATVTASACTPEMAACYARTAAELTERAASDAEALRAAVDRLCAAPSQETLQAAREAWLQGRRSYCRSEALRFAGGPIDARRGGVETFVNAWPVDESYIEPAGAPGRGLVGDRGRYPLLIPATLRATNQRGGETNVCTGWHAVEFMLWGRPASDVQAGSRTIADFLDGTPDADRRREYLAAIAAMLAEDLAAIAKAWKAGAAHRTAIESDPAAALRAMLIGPALLSAFEMGGERIAVAVETRNRHEQTSCFSDSSAADLRENLRGIERVLRGEGCPGAIAIIGERDPKAAEAIRAALDAAVRAADGLPQGFARAIVQPVDSTEHARLVAAMKAFEGLGESITAGAKALGVSLPTEPQG
jgi:putative iron-regulated protein